jgi:hypothetical protein
MARQNGQLTFQTPVPPTVASPTVLGDDASSTATVRVFTATERITVCEVGAIAGDSANVPDASFAFTASKRSGGDTAGDILIDVFTAAFAAEGGPGGDPSVQNFDNANRISGNVITNTAGLLAGGKALRAFCEVTLQKGDQIVFKVTGDGGGTSTVVFYARAYCDGAGLVEANDVDSN